MITVRGVWLKEGLQKINDYGKLDSATLGTSKQAPSSAPSAVVVRVSVGERGGGAAAALISCRAAAAASMNGSK
eukprot:m.87868 g.87868  ORF g.87868 m.87868 type:complete len:74 (+) comp14921_c0_seq5:1502-1723(+)